MYIYKTWKEEKRYGSVQAENEVSCIGETKETGQRG